MSRKGVISTDKITDFARRLKRIREKKGIAAKAMVDKLSALGVVIESSTYYRYEQAKANPSNRQIISALAQILGVSEDYIRCTTDYLNSSAQVDAQIKAEEYYKEKSDSEIYIIRNYLPIIRNLTFHLGHTNDETLTFREVYEIPYVKFYYELDEYVTDPDVFEPRNKPYIHMVEDGSYVVEMIKKEGVDSKEINFSRIYNENRTPFLTPDGDFNKNAEISAANKFDISEETFIQYLNNASSIEHYVLVDLIKFNKDSKRLDLIDCYRIPFREFVEQSRLYLNMFIDIHKNYNSRFRIMEE